MSIQKIKLKWNPQPYKLYVELRKKEHFQGIEKIFPDGLKRLCQTLLWIGGQRVCVSYDHIVNWDVSLTRSELIDYTGIVKIDRSHYSNDSNCAAVWMKNPDKYRLVTGYVLGNDDEWQSRIWLIDEEKHIIETEYPAEKYCGVVLNMEESIKFCGQVLHIN